MLNIPAARLWIVAGCCALGAAIGPRDATTARRHLTVHGYRFTIHMSLRQPNGNGTRMMVLHGQTADGTTRLDLVGFAGTGNEIAENEYMVITDSSSIAVNEITHAAVAKSIETGTLVTMMRARIGGQQATGFKSTFDSLGPGGVIDGRPTRKFRATFEYTLSGGRGGSTTTKSTYEYWLADLPFPFSNPLDGRLRPSKDSREMMAAELPALLAGWARMGGGTVVKTIANTTIGTAPYLRNMDLTEVKPAEIDPAIFIIPHSP